MKRLLILTLVLAMFLVAVPAHADPGILYVDDDGVCGENSPCYLHPQDAVNAANPGDTILVYPGTYGSRYFECPWKPNCSCSDNYSPALIVYKDDLTIKSAEGPQNTVIQATHTCWSNAIAVQSSTGGGVTGINGWAPSAAVIVASNVTIEGLTFHRPFTCAGIYDCFYNTAGVFIGSKGAGYSDFLGSANGATVKNNVFSDVWHAVYIWHSSDNTIVNNTVNTLGYTNHWAAISIYDGYNNAQIAFGNLSENNLIAHNTLANRGIALGAWAPSIWTSNAGSQVCHNTTTQVGVSYAHGPVIIGCNTGGFWQSNTDKVIRVKGVTYTGNTELWSVSNVDVNLSAQLGYDGSADGSEVEVVFTVNGTLYAATTVADGTASTTANLPPGIYTVETKVTICDDCEFTDTDSLYIGPKLITIDIKPGSDPNSINLKSKGVVPVAVLTTGAFDASTVDSTTVTFAGATPLRWAIEDVDSDGDVDMVFHFDTRALNLTATSIEATLTGLTAGGVPIQGMDSVNIVPGSK